MNIPREYNVWMSHNDYIEEISDNIYILAFTNNTPAIWKVKNNDKEIIGIQYHPEVNDTEYGLELINNFISLCKIPNKRFGKPMYVE